MPFLKNKSYVGTDGFWGWQGTEIGEYREMDSEIFDFGLFMGFADKEK